MKQVRVRCRREYLDGVILFALLLVSYAYFFPRWADPNQNSRLDMVVAVVEDGTYQIDKYVSNTVDYAKVGDHYYSDKAPGAAFIGIPIFAALKPVLDLPIVDRLVERLSSNPAFTATLRTGGTGILRQKVRFAVAQVVIALMVGALPTALLGLLIYRLLARFTLRPWARALIVVGYGVLTPAFAYAGAFYGHQLSAALLFGAFYLVFMATACPSKFSLWMVGLLLGYAMITEYPAALIAGLLGLYTLYRLWLWGQWKKGWWVALAGGVPVVGWMLYNSVVFGGPVNLGYSYSEQWLVQHHTGFMSFTWPQWEAVWGTTFGLFRGLFVLSPWLLLAGPGFWLWWRFGEQRSAFWVALTSVLAIFVFNASSIMWWGGFAVGPRYLLPMLPFLVLPIVFVFREWASRTVVRGVSVLLFAWSLVATWGLTLAGQSFPSDIYRNPLLEYAWPNWLTGNLARNLGTLLHLPGVLSLLPWLAIIFGLLVAFGVLVRRGPIPLIDGASSESGSAR